VAQSNRKVGEMKQMGEFLICNLEDLPDNWLVELSPQFRTNLFSELMKKRGYRKVALDLGITSGYLYHLKNGRHMPRIKLLKNIFRLYKVSSDACYLQVIAFVSNRGARIKLSLPLIGNKELARLVGHAFGDGNISAGKRQFDFVSKDAQRIVHVKKDAKEMFSCEPISQIQNKDGTYKVTFSTLVGEVLLIAGAPKGRKVEKRTHVPGWIMRGDKEIKREFLRALFDDDDSALFSRNYAAKNVNLHFTRLQKEGLVVFLNEIRELLKEFEITCSEPYVARKYSVDEIGRTVMGIIISSRKGIATFAREIGYREMTKAARLKCIVNA